MQKATKSILKKKTAAAPRYTPLTTDDTLRQLAFDNAAQANIITIVSTGKIIMANRAASKLLGYSKKELLTISRSAIFDINETRFKKMLKQRTAELESKSLVTVIKKSGRAFTCEITSAIFNDGNGIKNAITTITDMSESIRQQKRIDTINKKNAANDISLAITKQKKADIKKDKLIAGNIVLAQAKSDARLVENNEWIKYIAKASYDVMWDWDIASGQIYVGDSVKEVFGYNIQSNTTMLSDFYQCLLPPEKDKIENRIMQVLASASKVWNDAFSFTRNDGTVAYTTSRANIVRDDAGKALRMIGAIQDITRLQELEKNLEEQIVIHKEDSDKFLLTAKLSFDVIWDWNLVTNEVFLGDGFEELFGYSIKNNIGDMFTDWVNYIHPDDKEQVTAAMLNSIKSAATHWECGYRVSRADGSIARVYVRASIIRHLGGKAYRVIGAMQDLSRQKELEEKLEEAIKLKELQIAEATADAMEIQRSDIGKELHDNINQLLGASIMYLQMAKQGGGNSAMYLNRSTEYTFTAIDEIRKLTKGLTSNIIKDLGLGDAIDNICRDTMEVNPVKILLSVDSLKEDSVNEKFKLNVLRIVQEQLTNILKHARATQVNINLVQNKREIRLTITDNGVGFDTAKKQNGIGIPNIKSRVTAFNGIVDLVSQPGQGCAFTIIFPISEAVNLD